MTRKITFVGLLLCLCLALSSALFPGEKIDRSKLALPLNKLYGPMDKEYYLTAAQIAFIRPGLALELRKLTIPEDLHPVVEFSILDPAGLPLDIDGVFTPGPVSLTFIISRIPEGERQHVNYNTRTRTGPDGEPVTQADRDRGGSIIEVDAGVYAYTFNDPLPDDVDRSAPHTIGAYARRDLREFELDRYVDNDFIHFLPTEAEVTLLDAPPRDVVVTEACNQCHNPLAYHGGSRREIELCVQCHTPQTTSTTTGATVDFKVIIHRIHRGEDLPSVEAGTPNLIGRRDFSDVAFPQDIRNCEKCHVPGPDQEVGSEAANKIALRAAGFQGGTQSSAWLLRPSMAVCGACHDDLNFATGENHTGGRQISDNFCASCHFPVGEMEFSSDIKGAHTVPRKSQQLEGIDVEIVDVTGTQPGDNPTVFFTVKSHFGTTLDPSSFNRFRFNLAGSTTDYEGQVRESEPLTESVPSGDGFAYTFAATIPLDAAGTYVIGHESRRDAILNAGTTEEFAMRESSGENALFYFGVTDPAPVARRTVVGQEKCHQCHDLLSMHGGQRHTVQYCVTCHNPNGTDRGETQGIHFKYMIHRIHRGTDLTREFSVGNDNFNGVRFPGDLRDCETCHVDESYTIAEETGEFPLLPGLLPTVAPGDAFSPLPPITAACVGCHDTLAAAAHAFTQIAPFGEGCGACHGRGAEFAVEKVHSR